MENLRLWYNISLRENIVKKYLWKKNQTNTGLSPWHHTLPRRLKSLSDYVTLTCLFLVLFVCLFVCFSFFYRLFCFFFCFIFLFIQLFVCILYMFVCFLDLLRSRKLFFCLSVCLSACLLVCLSSLLVF